MNFLLDSRAALTSSKVQPRSVSFLSFRLSVIFDNLEKTLEVVFYSNPNIENSYSETFSEIDELIERLESQDDSQTEEVISKNEITFKSNMNFEQYTKCIEKIKDYIIEGDVMQVVFAQERSADFDLPPFELYKSLRKLNPSPYMFFLDFFVSIYFQKNIFFGTHKEIGRASCRERV